MVTIEYLLQELALEQRLRERPAYTHLPSTMPDGQSGSSGSATFRLWLAQTLLRASRWVEPQRAAHRRA